MGELDVKAYQLEIKCNHGYWQDRIVAQIKYATQLSELREGRYDALINRATDFLLEKWQQEKTLTPSACMEAESMLLPLKEDAKSFTLHCMSHAHIDMNWMWRFDETVSITLDTFRTMLDLLREYPQFTFSQSQASTYHIVEQYGPEGMLDEIRRYVKEGRWEVTASTWVEADKNTPSGESMARHLLYTRRYLTELLHLSEDSIRLDFEPDTFGHSANVPAILADAGVEYYYHVRGSLDPELVWWEAPAGKRVLSCRDINGYSSIVTPEFGLTALAQCKELGVTVMPRVYGVGDHGGGPSRRDIERIMDMQGWPVYPTLEFSTYHRFFDEVKARFGNILPVRKTEMNFIFTGCYTSQSRLKLANRVGEGTLHEAELYSALAAAQAHYRYTADRFEDAWRKLLFNQFHDILTGSGVRETREHAMGRFQELLATANNEKAGALRALASRIDTSRFDTGESKAAYRTEGAGAAKGTCDFKISQVDRGCGSVRIYHIFNPSPRDREELAELTVWDWAPEALPLMEFRNEQGEILPHQRLKEGNEWFWSHDFATVLLPVKVPACGWTTITLQESRTHIVEQAVSYPHGWQQVEEIYQYILENECVKVCFDTGRGTIVSYVDKRTGTEWIPRGKEGGFRLIDEDPGRMMTSWRTGRHMNIRGLESVRIRRVYRSGAALRESITIEAEFGRSSLHAEFSLDPGSALLHIRAECDWHERAVTEKCVPQLNFYMPLAGQQGGYCYDVPFGTCIREAIDMDLPGNSFVAAMPENLPDSFILTTDSKYGYRGYDNAVQVALIRSTYDPDPCPEYGLHKFQIAVGPADRNRARLVQCAFDLWHPFNTLASSVHTGSLPLSGNFIRLDSDAAVLQSLKRAEDEQDAWIIRLYDAGGSGGDAQLHINMPVADNADIVDLHEKPLHRTLPVSSGALQLHLSPGEMLSVRIRLRQI